MLACATCGRESESVFAFCPHCGAPLGASASGEQRKTVTVVFCDVAGSTALGESTDPEALRALLARYFERMKEIVERHGGTVEKFIGDAIMAAFGVPVLHEDDALRATRAAVEMRRALPELGVQARIGVNTGEVVTGTQERLATGDAVNVGSRLEQAAPSGEILLGEATYALVRDAVEVEAVEPLELKGKADAVPAFRLLGLLEDAPAFARRLDAPMVGREGELAKLRAALEQAIAERACRIVTVIGSPGIGKSRVAREFVAGLAHADALWGRCLPYGEGITYWPLVEIFRAAGAEEELGAALSAGAPEEIFWSVRKSLERRARERPLVCVLDDLHWAEPTLLDLVENLSDWSRDAPILLLCLARPELLAERPAWGGAESLALEPLADRHADELIESLFGSPLDGGIHARVREAAAGNPLFVEQLVAMLAEGGDPDHVPPTIRALLSARVDGLPGDESEVLGHASVIGIEFDWEALAALDPDGRRPPGAVLSALVRKEFIRLHETKEDSFLFRHVLIRDAAYERMPKRRRAELHARFADHLAGIDELPERDELAGYHLEQAHAYRAELGPLDADGRELAARAAQLLGSAGLRAFRLNDIGATVGLLGRACALLPEGDAERLKLLPDLGAALGEAGRFDESESALTEAVRAADRAVAGNAKVERQLVRLQIESAEWTEEAEAVVRELLPVFEELEDDEALARFWRLSGMIGLMRSRYADLAAATERALEHARRAGDEREAGLSLFWIPQAAVWGPTPARDGIRRCEFLLVEAAGSTSAEAGVRNGLSMLYAMVGRAEEARAAWRESCETYRELGLEVMAGVAAMHAGPVELYLGGPAAAERGLRQAMDTLERLGERGYRSTAAVWLAQALNEQARYAEAAEATRLSEELAPVDDTPSQVGWRGERARALARQGKVEEAERLARESVALSEPTDTLVDIGESAFALAEVLWLAGRNDEAAEAAGEALEAWEAKGIVGYVERAHALQAQLGVAR
jgi:class 3 adenylate cyclase/tetratricopeptide (TPR) repeat protein